MSVQLVTGTEPSVHSAVELRAVQLAAGKPEFKNLLYFGIVHHINDGTTMTAESGLLQTTWPVLQKA